MDLDRIAKAVREILEAIGEDPDRDGLHDTPERVARRTIRAIRRDEGLVVMTWAAHLFYGFKRLAPRLMSALYRVRRRKPAACRPGDGNSVERPAQRAA